MKHTLMALLLGATLWASPAQAQDDHQKIESAKIAYITNRLNLNSNQATQFWPIYNEYNGRKRELNRRIRQLNGEGRQATTDANALNNLREANAAKQKLVELDNEYMDRFLKVISAQQLAELNKAERMFNKMLLERLSGPRD